MVTLPNDCFNETTFPSGVFAEKSGAIAPISTGDVTFFFAFFEHFELILTSIQFLYQFWFL